MAPPLLETKLFLPAPRPGLVPRTRLRERLDGAIGAKVVLVSAPAGFGKTTLLVDWLASLSAPAGGPRAAWLALDAADNDPTRFWSYVLAALRTAAPGAGQDALALLQEPQPPPVELLLTTPDQRPRDARERRPAGARRLPPDRLRRGPGRAPVPGGAPAGPAAAGARQPHRPGSAAVPAAGARRAGRGAGRRPALHRRRGRRLPQRRDGARPHRTRHRGARGAHRGLDRSAAAGRSLDDRPGRRARASSRASPATTASSSTTSWRR